MYITYNVYYVYYIGDGNSKTFTSIQDIQPYGDVKNKNVFTRQKANL